MECESTAGVRGPIYTFFLSFSVEFPGTFLTYNLIGEYIVISNSKFLYYNLICLVYFL
jgi:hypothetical protein